MDGFTNGFSIEYHGDEQVKLMADNLKFTIGDEVDLWNKVMKEVKLKHYAGPFKEIPYENNYIQSPIGLVPKDNGKDMRLIFHLSHPRKSAESKSVNANTPKDKARVRYPDFSDAVRRCIEELQIGKRNSCYVSKSDFSAAFRNLGIKPEHWRYLIMKAKNRKTGEWCFFVDKCLLFGAAISCAHFQAVSDAIAHIVEHFTKKTPINYLDDFLFIAWLKALYDEQLRVFLQICEEINMPVSEQKTLWSSTQIVFLGFLIDTI